MIEVFPFAGLPVAVFGLGNSGLAAARGLMQAKAEVWAWDDNGDARAGAEGIPLVDLYDCDWKELTTLVLSPGIPLHYPKPHPIVEMARAHNCEIIGDVELLGRSMRDAAYVGITGTNGKSTTTALLGHIMQVSGREAEIGGNLGTPAIELEPLGAEGVYVLEMSSYQLDLTFSITFDVAILLNISPDHLDRHGGFDGYIKSKKTIFNRQTKPRAAVVGVDDEPSRKICEELKSAGDQVVIPISGLGPVSGGVYAEGGMLIDDMENTAIPVLDLKNLAALPGVHNWQNAAAAFAAAKAAKVAPHAAMACIQSFPGLVHRQELVEVIEGVAFVNDSKATNPEAAARALACYDNIYWIAGGRAKQGGLEALQPCLGRVRRAFLIGEAAEAMAKALDGRVDATLCGDLATALEKARTQVADDAVDGAVVLLSPACASFDQFDNFEVRGEAFRRLVEALPGRRDEDAA